MPDAQGVSSFIGNFMQGFMQQSAQAESDKLRKVSSMMQLASYYEQQARNPNLPEGARADAESSYTKYVTDADKLMNQKVSGIGSIMGLFGIGKGKKGASIPSVLFQPLEEKKTYVPAAGEGDTTGGQAQISALLSQAKSGPLPPGYREDGAGNIMPTAGSLADLVNPGRPLADPRTELIDQMNPAGMPGPMGQTVTTLEAPKASPLNAVAQYQMTVKQAQLDQARQNNLTTLRDTNELNQEFNRKNAEDTRQQNAAQLAKFFATPIGANLDQDAKDQITSEVIYGIKLPTTKPRIYTVDERNADGSTDRVIRDVANNTVLYRSPKGPSAAEAKREQDINGYITTGLAKGATPQEQRADAERLYERDIINGRRSMVTSRDLGNKSKELDIEFKRRRNEAKAKIEAGALTSDDARQLMKDARTWAAKQMENDTASFGLEGNERRAMEVQYIRQAIEGDAMLPGIGITYEKLMSIISGTPPRTPADTARSFMGGIAGPKTQAPAAKASPGKF